MSTYITDQVHHKEISYHLIFIIVLKISVNGNIFINFLAVLYGQLIVLIVQSSVGDNGPNS